MDDIISAREARIIASDNLPQLQEINNLIKAAAYSGDYSIEYETKSLPDIIKNILEERGYTISTKFTTYTCTYIIDW
jgi:hypothetical protein